MNIILLPYKVVRCPYKVVRCPYKGIYGIVFHIISRCDCIGSIFVFRVNLFQIENKQQNQFSQYFCAGIVVKL